MARPHPPRPGVVTRGQLLQRHEARRGNGFAMAAIGLAVVGVIVVMSGGSTAATRRIASFTPAGSLFAGGPGTTAAATPSNGSLATPRVTFPPTLPPAPDPTPTPTPTATPIDPTPTPTPSPTPPPTPKPTAAPTAAPTGQPTARPTPTPTERPTQPPAQGLVIVAPENGAEVNEATVVVRGRAPAGATVTLEIPWWFDQHVQADNRGRWSMTVGLVPGRNELTFRLGNDLSTRQRLIIFRRNP